MDKRLVEAARVGDVMALHRIMEEDPEILEKESLAHSVDSVLHVASRRGKAEFVKVIVRLMPSLVTATNQKGLIPSHMASAQGHVDTVNELLKAKLDDDDVQMINQCLVKEDDGWIPLHYAVFRVRVGVIQELMRHSPECVEEVTAKGETVLHLAVKANQLNVVQVIVESIKSLPNFQTLLKAKDINGNAVYDLAPAKKQLQVLEILKEDDDKKEGDEIREEHHIKVESESKTSNKKEMSNEPKSQQEAILVVPTLFITLTYQATANPPPTFLKEGSTKIDWGCFLSCYVNKKKRSQSLPKRLQECPAILASAFIIFNTLIFFTSIFAVVITLRGPRIYLVKLLTVYLISCYCVLLTALNYNIVYGSLPFATLVIVAFFVFSRKDDAMRMLGMLVAYGRPVCMNFLLRSIHKLQIIFPFKDRLSVRTKTGSQSHNITGRVLFDMLLLFRRQFKENMNRSFQILNNLHGYSMINDLKEPPLHCSIGN